MYKFDFSAFEKQGIKRVGELNPYITLACDLRCRYCYMFNYLAKANNQTEIMQPEFLLSMAEYFAKYSGGLDRMTLLGGEPTLHPTITQICNEAGNLPIKELRMTTNGIGTHCLDLDKLNPGVFDHISISIDGVDSQTNDATRGKGAFDRIIHTIGLYKQAGIPVSINYTVTNKNIRALRDIIPFFADKGVSIINLHRASLDGNAYSNQDILVDAQSWVVARDDLFSFIKEKGGSYPNLKIRVPYTFLTQEQIGYLGYVPIQEQNYHSPQGGHRLIVFPPTEKGEGLCYMSSDVIGQPNAELGKVDENGNFSWNAYDSNEMIAYRRSMSMNVSTDIKGQTEGVESLNLLRVSHSFKAVIDTNRINEFKPINDVCQSPSYLVNNKSQIAGTSFPIITLHRG